MLRLASGIEIDDPATVLRGYARHVCPRYDGVIVPHDNELRESEIKLSNSFGSRLHGREAADIYQHRDAIGAALATVPADVDLMAVPLDAAIPGEGGISQTINIVCGLDGVGVPKATKILHKKRPGVIPILDSVVQGNYWKKWVHRVQGRSEGDYAVAVIRAIHRDMHAIAAELADLRAGLIADGTTLTPCRILDILIWIVRTNNTNYYRQRG